jgi:hypothetical protein
VSLYPDLMRGEYRPGARGPVFEVTLNDDDLELLTLALWDLAALHTAYPRRHVDRLHALRRYLLAIQISRRGGEAWNAALPAPPPEST